MFKTFKGMTLAAALAIVTIAAAPTAEARDRWRDRGDNDAALAIGAGIVGLAIGAAIASDRNDRYYRDRYYRSYPRYYNNYPRYRDYRRDYRRDWRRDRGDWNRNHNRRYYRY